MPLSTAKSSTPLSPVGKMEDRKRAALSAPDDMAPPSKRHQVNGSTAAKDDDTKEDAWIEVGPSPFPSPPSTLPLLSQPPSPARQGRRDSAF